MAQDDGIVVEESPGNESAMDERLERMAGQLATVNDRLASVEAAVVNVSDRLTAVETAIVIGSDRLTAVETAVAIGSDRLTAVETAVVIGSDRLTAVEATVVSLDSRIDARFDDLGRQMRVLYEQTRDDMRALDPGFELRSEMRRADASLQRQIDDNEQRNQDAHRWFKSQLEE